MTFSGPVEVNVKLKRLYKDAFVPTYANPGDAGADLYAYGVRHVDPDGKLSDPEFLQDIGSVTLFPHGRILITTGIAIALPEGTEAQVRSRSGASLKLGLVVLNSPGTIDAGYRGEVAMIAHNSSAKDVIAINHLDRIGQLVIAPVYHAVFHEFDELPQAVRGENGYGSSGIKSA